MQKRWILSEVPGARTTISINSAPIRDAQGRIVKSVAVFHDITERKRTEARLHQLNRTLRALSNTNQVMIHAKSERQLLDEVCKIVVEDCGHSMVWIGYAQDDEKKSVKPVASAGFEAGYLKNMISVGEIIIEALVQQTPIVPGNPAAATICLLILYLRHGASRPSNTGYAFSLVLPLITEDKVFGAITISSRNPTSFSAGRGSPAD